jgi:predicted transcriptional regulator
MIKLLEEAIAKVRDLPEAVQQEAAEMLLSVAAKAGEPVRLDDETRAAVRQGVAQARRGEFVPDEIVQKVNRQRERALPSPALAGDGARTK